jgi:hypothetical protein
VHRTPPTPLRDLNGDRFAETSKDMTMPGQSRRDAGELMALTA